MTATAEVLGLAARYAQADGERAAQWVAEYIRDRGCSPTWAELRAAMNWPKRPRATASTIIRDMSRQGWLRWDRDESRSLRPGPAARQGAAR
jgi:DNA-binding IclR family transcriptional regulator